MAKELSHELHLRVHDPAVSFYDVRRKYKHGEQKGITVFLERPTAPKTVLTSVIVLFPIACAVVSFAITAVIDCFIEHSAYAESCHSSQDTSAEYPA